MSLRTERPSNRNPTLEAASADPPSTPTSTAPSDPGLDAGAPRTADGSTDGATTPGPTANGYSADLCGNGVDDDGNGLIDDACPVTACTMKLSEPIATGRFDGLTFLKGAGDFVAFGRVSTWSMPAMQRFVSGTSSGAPAPLDVQFSQVDAFLGGPTRFATEVFQDAWSDFNGWSSDHAVAAQALDKVLLCRGGPRCSEETGGEIDRPRAVGCVEHRGCDLDLDGREPRALRAERARPAPALSLEVIGGHDERGRRDEGAAVGSVPRDGAFEDEHDDGALGAARVRSGETRIPDRLLATLRHDPKLPVQHDIVVEGHRSHA